MGQSNSQCPNSASYCFCGTTPRITSEDFSSCEMAIGSFVFSIVSGICIGSISLSNIIGIAYVNKKLSIGQLVLITCVFEAVGMMAMSRFTLQNTITKTINFEEITNLRKAFITLGSTQLCSMLFLINVLIFALPISSTHVVISGLTGVSLIFYSEEIDNYWWFLEEFGMWLISPLLAVGLVLCCYSLVRK